MEIFIVILFVAGMLLFVKIAGLENRIDSLEKELKDLKDEIFVEENEAEKSNAFSFVEKEIDKVSDINTKAESISSKKLEISTQNFDKKPSEILFAKNENYNLNKVSNEKVSDFKNRELKTKNEEMEFNLGSRVFTGIGAVAVIFGIGFFLRYSFENNLVTPAMRVILGIIFGLGMLVVGEFTRKKFATYSQILTGAGLGVLYLALFSAFSIYALIPHILAFIGMFAVMIFGVFLAVRYNSLVLAIFSQIGGLLTPILLSTGENRPHALFLYLTLLNVGILMIAWWKLWRSLAFISFFGTITIYLGWFLKFYDESQILVAQGYATLFFLIFISVLLVHNFIRKALQNSSDLLLVMVNSVFYFLVSYQIINENNHQWLGLFTFILAVFHFYLVWLVKEIKNEKIYSSKLAEKQEIKLYQILMSVGIVLLSVAIPIQFDKHWVTIFWAMESLILTFFSFQINSKLMRVFANGIYFFTFIRLIFVDSQISYLANPFLNDRVFSFIICIILFILTILIYQWKKDEITKDEKVVFQLLAFFVGIVFLLGGTLEIYDFLNHYWFSIFWSLTFILLFVFSWTLKSYLVRILAFFVAMMNFFRLLFVDMDLEILDETSAILNLRVILFLTAIFSSLVVLFFYKLFQKEFQTMEINFSSQIISLYVYILTIFLFTAEIYDFFAEFWLPIVWSVIATFSIFIALKTKNLTLRTAVYLTFLVVFIRLLVEEGNVNLETYYPILNVRVASFLAVSILMGIVLFLLKKTLIIGEGEKKWCSIFLFLTMNFLLIYLVSVEFVDYFKQQFLQLPKDLKQQQMSHFKNLENVSLSISWTIYSVILLILGIVKKSTISRFLAIFIFGIVIFKVFLFDTSTLNTLYKFVSFITLGIILLLTGFLYNRYKNRIVEFIKV